MQKGSATGKRLGFTPIELEPGAVAHELTVVVDHRFAEVFSKCATFVGAATIIVSRVVSERTTFNFAVGKTPDIQPCTLGIEVVIEVAVCHMDVNHLTGYPFDQNSTAIAGIGSSGQVAMVSH